MRGKRFKEKSELLSAGGSGLSVEELAEIESLAPEFNEEELLVDLDQKYKDIVKVTWTNNS